MCEKLKPHQIFWVWNIIESIVSLQSSKEIGMDVIAWIYRPSSFCKVLSGLDLLGVWYVDLAKWPTCSNVHVPPPHFPWVVRKCRESYNVLEAQEYLPTYGGHLSVSVSKNNAIPVAENIDSVNTELRTPKKISLTSSLSPSFSLFLCHISCHSIQNKSWDVNVPTSEFQMIW